MSGAPATVSAAPSAPAPAPAVVPSNPVEQAPDPAGSAGSFQSFTEVLSAQRAQSGHDDGGRHEADGKRGSSHGAKEAQAPTASSPSSSADDPPAIGSLPAVPPLSGLAEVAVAAAGTAGAGAGAGGSCPGTEGGPPVPVGGREAAPGHPAASLSALGLATGSTAADATAPAQAGPAAPTEADVPTAITGTDSDTAGGASADESTGTAGTGAGAVTPAATATALTTGLADPKADSPVAAMAALSHGDGTSTSPGAGHVAPAGAEVAGVPAAAPTPPPLPHLMSESPLAASDPTRAASVLRAGESAGPSTESVAASGTGSLDVGSLSESISRPLSDGNGTYTVTVALHPPELGHLQAVVSLDGNDLSVALTAQTQTGHDALANAADALKDQLARGGVNVNVSLRDPGSQPGGEERYRPPTTSGGPFLTEGAAAETPLSSGLVASQIHLVL